MKVGPPVRYVIQEAVHIHTKQAQMPRGCTQPRAALC
jgi:hypothetical protein